MSYQNEQMSRFDPDGRDLHGSPALPCEAKRKDCSMCGESVKVKDMMYGDFCLDCFEKHVEK